MLPKRFKIYFVGVLFACVCFVLAPFIVLADSSSTPVTITATVPSSGAVCGNGSRESGEQCDDGNVNSGDGCSALCVIEPPVVGGGDNEAPIVHLVATSTTQTSANLSWQATDNFYVQSCQFVYGLSTNYSAQIQPTRSGDNFAISATGLTPDTVYYFRISCADDVPHSSVVTGTFVTLLPDNQAPVITQLVATPVMTTATVSWQATDDTVVDSCVFSYDTDGPTLPYAYSGQVAGLSGHAYETALTRLLPNTIYYYRISCSDATPNTTVALGTFQTTPDSVPPADASGLRATSRNSAALLTWVYPTTVSDVAAFEIRRNVGQPPSSIGEGTLVVRTTNIADRQYLDTGLINDVTYGYTLFVIDTSNNHSNGVTALATPYTAGDRDGDGIGDDIDLCDLNNPGQIDTPAGTIVADNGCPNIIIDSSDLSAPLRSLITQQAGRVTVTIPPVSIRNRVESFGLQPGTWYVDYINYHVSFTVDAAGGITWPSSLNNTFSSARELAGTRLSILGYHFVVDSRAVDPRGQFRIYSAFGSTPFLPDVATVSLYPKPYTLAATFIAPFTLQTDGSISWTASYNSFYSFSGNTLYVNGTLACIRQDTLQSTYRFISLHGQTSYVSGNIEVRMLPAYYDYGPGIFAAANPYIQAFVSTRDRKNMNLFVNPIRLYDPTDGETGNIVNLTINSQNVQAGIGDCRVPGRQCGNGIIELTEQCDDGNTRNGDGCSAFCSVEVVSVCGNGVINDPEQCDDGNVVDNDGCSALCQTETPVCGNSVIEFGEQCDDGNVVDNDGCSALCQNVPVSVCGNSIVESGEQCDDGNRVSRDGCSNLCLIDTPIRPACSDLLDNDHDGLVDLADPGCTDPQDNSEYESPLEQTVDVANDNITFFLAERTIQTQLENNTLTSLEGDQWTVFIPHAQVGTSTVRMEMVFADRRYRLTEQVAGGVYAADVVMPESGEYDAVIEWYDAFGLVRSEQFRVRSLSYGLVYFENQEVLPADTSITLLLPDGGVWPGDNFRQANPILSSTGEYGFVVPNGDYILRVQGTGFRSTDITLSVRDHVVHEYVSVIKLFDQEILQQIDDFFGGSISEFVSFASANINKAVRVVAALANNVKNFVADPQVQSATKKFVVPTVTGLSAVALAPSLWEIAIPLLRYVFLQPLLLLGKRKRKEWGIVYNSLNKMPVDLATIRLVDQKTKRVIQSRVSDFDGRYIFFAPAGRYEIQVSKSGFLFPTSILGKIQSDGSLSDIYHGEELQIAQKDQSITPNIPLDPVGADKAPRRIMWENKLKMVQNTVSLAGLIFTLVVFVIIPSLITGLYILIHVILYVLFLGFLAPKKPKQWGTVFDMYTKKPVEKAIVRLFSTSYNRLIATQVTSATGTYAFLVGPSSYYVTVEHPMYTNTQTRQIDKTHEKQGFINDDIAVSNKASSEHKNVI